MNPSPVLALTQHFIQPEALVSDYQHLIEHMTNDPKDRHVLAAAVAAQARVIVTSNLHDFPEAALAPSGLEAQSPDAFLSDLFQLSPLRMRQIVTE